MDGLIRRREMVEKSESGGSPLYPLDGTYAQSSGGTTTITIVGQHWRIVHASAAGNGTATIYTYSENQVSGTRAWKAELSNLNIVSGNISNQTIQVRNAYGQALNLTSLADGTTESTYTPTAPSVRPQSLTLNIPYSGAYEVEFDLKVYVDGVLYH